MIADVIRKKKYLTFTKVISQLVKHVQNPAGISLVADNV